MIRRVRPQEECGGATGAVLGHAAEPGNQHGARCGDLPRIATMIL